MNEIELVRNESNVTITTFPFALHRDFQRTSHGHERDIQRCQEPDRSLKTVRFNDDVIDDDIESTRCDAPDDAVPALS